MYKNRYQSLLKAINEKKQRDDEAVLALAEKAEKKKQKIKQKALAQIGDVNSKFLEEKVPVQEPVVEAPKLILVARMPPTISTLNRTSLLERQQKAPSELNETTSSLAKQEKVRVRSSRSTTRRANSTAGVMNVLGKVYTSKTTGGMKTTASRGRHGSRGSNRSDNSGQPHGLGVSKQRSEASLTGRQRTLTPKPKKFGRKERMNVVMSAAEQLAFDEALEEEELKKAEERKRRAQAIRDRND
jgi:hypothetical protein